MLVWLQQWKWRLCCVTKGAASRPCPERRLFVQILWQTEVGVCGQTGSIQQQHFPMWHRNTQTCRTKESLKIPLFTYAILSRFPLLLLQFAFRARLLLQKHSVFMYNFKPIFLWTTKHSFLPQEETDDCHHLLYGRSTRTTWKMLPVIESEEKNGKKMQMSRWLCNTDPP